LSPGSKLFLAPLAFPFWSLSGHSAVEGLRTNPAKCLKGLVRHDPTKRTPPLKADADFHLSDSFEFLQAPLYKSRNFLNQKYSVEGLSIGQIAEEIVSSKAAVRNGLRHFGIPLRKNPVNRGRLKFGERIRNGRVVPHPGELKVIRSMIEMRNQGMSLEKIALLLNQMGIHPKRNGLGWQHHTVNKLISRHL